MPNCLGCEYFRPCSTAGTATICDELQSAPFVVSVSDYSVAFFIIELLVARGFKELIPHFAIRESGPDEHRLPTSSTCVNLLKVSMTFSDQCTSSSAQSVILQLPQYKSEKILREKLLQAITSNAGFDLS
jgi:hypothetical protein